MGTNLERCLDLSPATTRCRRESLIFQRGQRKFGNHAQVALDSGRNRELCSSRDEHLVVENLVLRQQLTTFNTRRRKPGIGTVDRAFSDEDGDGRDLLNLSAEHPDTRVDPRCNAGSPPSDLLSQGNVVFDSTDATPLTTINHRARVPAPALGEVDLGRALPNSWRR